MMNEKEATRIAAQNFFNRVNYPVMPSSVPVTEYRAVTIPLGHDEWELEFGLGATNGLHVAYLRPALNAQADPIHVWMHMDFYTMRLWISDTPPQPARIVFTYKTEDSQARVAFYSEKNNFLVEHYWDGVDTATAFRMAAGVACLYGIDINPYKE